MPWRVTYWRGTTRVQEMTFEKGSQTQITDILERLATQQGDLDIGKLTAQASSCDQEICMVRANRSGSMLWTTGKDFHYTAEWYLRGPRKGTRKSD